jgi:hypothetical protein
LAGELEEACRDRAWPVCKLRTLVRRGCALIAEKQYPIPQTVGRDVLKLGSLLGDRRSGRAGRSVPLAPLLKRTQCLALWINSGRDFDLLRRRQPNQS